MEFNTLTNCRGCLDADLVNMMGFCSSCWEDVKDNYVDAKEEGINPDH
ncbi:hypothetical protein [Paenibacillus gallinarum]|uniref:DUF1289 domain-containing protein n=1 Tax=Paenibacillus gallinarum TaxID=2762232 RepID=A0ABR8T4C5_9BACL|nr:hypothetical protein [Paenibacillus gallinarum]MBD7970378.1 hypothetical protein [Paenibacillus gallinarum]